MEPQMLLVCCKTVQARSTQADQLPAIGSAPPGVLAQQWSGSRILTYCAVVSAGVLDTGSSHARKPHGSGLSADSTPGCSSAACVWRIHGEFLSSYMMVQEH